jgi:hypothetical protein
LPRIDSRVEYENYEKNHRDQFLINQMLNDEIKKSIIQ